MVQNDCKKETAARVYPGAAGRNGTAGANGVNGADGANGDNASPHWGNDDSFALHVNAANWTDGLTHLLNHVFNALPARKSKGGKNKK
jgi:hypothetical protein